MLRRVFRIGIITLDGNALHLRNRTYETSVVLDDQHAEKWRQYLMAYNRGGNARGRGGARKPNAGGKSVRLTGLFAARKPGLYVGTARPEDLRSLGPRIRQALDSGLGLTFFLWDNEGRGEEGDPRFNLTADVANERPKARPQADEDDGDSDDTDLPF